LIELVDVTKIYRLGPEEIHALHHFTLTIAQGQFVAVIGPSGSGKSTLLHLIGGLDTPTSGRVLVGGQDLSRGSDRTLAAYRNRWVGFVFQTFNLQPTYTALENVALPLVFARVPPRERYARAQEALATVGLADRARHRPSQLSGGERQRVGIARALANNPQLLLADEPTGNLDSVTGGKIVDLLWQLNQERGLTVVMVTHDQGLAQRADRRVFLRDGQIIGES